MDWSGCGVVERVQGRLSGAPVLRHTRMAADWVVDNAEDLSPEEIAEDFDLNLDDVREVIAYAASHRELPVAS